MYLNDKFEMEIDDLSVNGKAAAGVYTILFSISDGKDVNLLRLTVIVKPAQLKKGKKGANDGDSAETPEDADDGIPDPDTVKKKTESTGGPERMTLNLKAVTQTGIVNLSFSRPVEFAPGVLIPNEQAKGNKRSLKEQAPEAIQINLIVKKALKITYKPAIGSQAELLDFGIIEFKNTTDLSL